MRSQLNLVSVIDEWRRKQPDIPSRCRSHPSSGEVKRRMAHGPTRDTRSDVLEFFQADGPGWQERINAALRKAAGK